MEPSSPLRTEPHGIIGLLEQQNYSWELPTETVYSLRLDIMEPSSLHLMEPLGLKEPLEYQKVSLESPTEMVPS